MKMRTPYKKYNVFGANKPLTIFGILLILSFLIPAIIRLVNFENSIESAISSFILLIGITLLYAGISSIKNKEVPGYFVFSFDRGTGAIIQGTILIVIGGLLAIGGLIRLIIAIL